MDDSALVAGNIAGVQLSEFAFQAQRDSTNQSIAASVLTKLGYNSEVSDPKGDYDPTTNFRYTPSESGEYFVSAVANLANLADDKTAIIRITKNGLGISQSSTVTGRPSAGSVSISTSTQIDMNGTTDFLEIFILHNDTVVRDFEGFNNKNTANFNAQKVGE